MTTYVDVLKANAKINVEFQLADVTALQGILLRHLAGKNNMDNTSYDVITELCTRIDEAAVAQHQTVSKPVNL